MILVMDQTLHEGHARTWPWHFLPASDACNVWAHANIWTKANMNWNDKTCPWYSSFSYSHHLGCLGAAHAHQAMILPTRHQLMHMCGTKGTKNGSQLGKQFDLPLFGKNLWNWPSIIHMMGLSMRAASDRSSIPRFYCHRSTHYIMTLYIV
jgi:hypothetical protein